MTKYQYLIWSNEHNAWWAERECGYVTDKNTAGRYTLERAKEICEQSYPLEDGCPAEVIVRVR